MASYKSFKLDLCVRLARQCSRDSWQQPKEHRAEYLRIKRESIADARYWMTQP